MGFASLEAQGTLQVWKPWLEARTLQDGWMNIKTTQQ